MNSHWRFFESLDEDLHHLARYVEPVPDNFDCYSIEIARLFIATCSEVDVIAKLLCLQIAPDRKPTSIHSYKEIIVPHFDHFCDTKTELPQFSITITPWEHWHTQDSPSWWRDYNKVKHERNRYFSKGSLYNLLAASSGLLVLLFFHSYDDLRTNRYIPKFKFLQFHTNYAGCMKFGYEYSHPQFPKIQG